jgi:UDP-GlcNAc:undecaprenyl-phosphate GlcNAc-1-phosphate transferase
MSAMKWPKVIEALVVAALVSYLITPLIMTIARRTGYLDYPKSNKVHAHPTPLMGGVSIYIAFITSILATINIGHDPRLLSIAIGSTLLLVVGLIDDRLGMMPEVKLLAQFFAAMCVIKAGVRIDFLQNYYLNTIFTYLWIVGITNAFNLLDNMNGLSAGIAAIAAIFFGIVMWNGTQMAVAIVSFAIAGASIGFLKHNFPHARIFMGDSGSLVLGFLLASTAILGSWSTRFLTTSLAMPVIILAYPIFDTTLVTIMRIKEGRSIFQGGKDHSSHRLALIGFKKKGAVLVVYGVCIALGISALIIQKLPLVPALIVIVIVAVSMAAFGIRLAMVDTGRFGRAKSAKQIA